MIRADWKEAIEEDAEGKIVMLSTPTCGVCRMMERVLDSVENKTGYKGYKVDLTEENNEHLIKEYEVSSVPVLLYIKNNKVVEQKVGFQQEVQVEEVINNI